MNNSELVLQITNFIPRGMVTTYGFLAKLAGLRNPRVVGNILHRNPDAPRIPCHRVVDRNGRMGSAYPLEGPKAQEKRLKEEGVEVAIGKVVNLPKYLWRPSLVLKLYLELLSIYGDPGLWPWVGTGPAHTPEEIAIGAILTQNTNWKNVEKALNNLKIEKACTIKGIYELGRASPKAMPAARIRNYGRLLELIKPSGYYNQKAKRLFGFCKFIIEEHKTLKDFLRTQNTREKLLSLHGIGPETADTILLYASNQPVFVIDAYTKKFAIHHKLTRNLSYDGLQKFFLENLPEHAKLFQDYHALIVKWGKSQKFPPPPLSYIDI